MTHGGIATFNFTDDGTTPRCEGDPMAIDASQVTYSPEDDADWKNGVDPGDVDDALDQLAAEGIKGPASSTNDAITRWDGTTGKLLQDSQVIVDDNGAMTGVRSITGEAGQSFQLLASSEQTCTVLAGDGGSTSNGALAKLQGGDGGVTSGDGGPANVLGGAVPPGGSGDGGSCNITAEDGVGTNKAGGDANLTAGEPTGSGTAGIVHAKDDFAWSNKTEGGTGRLVRRTTHETHTLATASTSDTATISIPSGARLLGVSMNVNTAVTTDGLSNNFWSAAFITGSTTTIVTDASEAQNTKVPFIVPDEKTTAVTQIRFTATDGNFNTGVIEVVAWFEEVTNLADV